MNIKELIKDLDPVTIIEFKNYIIEHLSDLCSTKSSNSKLFLNLKIKKYFVRNVDVNYIRMEKQKMVFKNIFVVAVRPLHQKHQIQ